MEKGKKGKTKKGRKAETGRIWRPSARQVRIAELLLNPEDRRSKKDKYESIGLPERTFYKWMKDDRFVDYLNSQIGKYTNAELYEIWKSLMMQCKRGNIEAMKLFFKMKELDPDIKMKHSSLELEREKIRLQREHLNKDQSPDDNSCVQIVDDIVDDES
jgi:hypothetical protein